MSEVSPVRVEEAEVLRDLTHDHRRKIPALTGIRGYAAMWVVLLHCFFLGSRMAPDYVRQVAILDHGYLAVDLFFILSGYVLLLSYGSKLSLTNSPAVREFVVGRIFRILPLHWIVLTFLAILTIGHGPDWATLEPHTFKTFVLSLTLTQAWFNRPAVWNSPAWSLSAEWLAYVFFPLIAVGVKSLSSPRSTMAVTWLLLIGLVVLCCLVGQPTLNQVRVAGLARALFEFTAGACIFRWQQLARPGTRTASGCFIGGLLLLAAAMAPAPADFLALPAFVLLVAACAADAPQARVIFGNRTAHFLGEISFSVYLLHWPLIELVIRFWPHGRPLALGLASVPIIMIPLAWATWRWIEVPGQAVGRSIIKRLRARDQRLAA